MSTQTNLGAFKLIQIQIKVNLLFVNQLSHEYHESLVYYLFNRIVFPNI